ncbi:MAG TPA: hypothetical protein VF680_00245 [Allosphingosinicella sp.]|jgi:hypothetical protein
MRNVFLIAGAAALAMSMPVLAEKGGKGGGNGGGGGGKGQSGQAHGGGGGGHGGGAKAGHGGGGGGQARQAPAQRQSAHGGDGGGKHQQAVHQVSHGGGKPQRAERQASRGNGHAQRVERQAARMQKPAKAERMVRQARSIAPEQGRNLRFNDVRQPDLRNYSNGGLNYASAGQNCPPGLARKGNGCMPPGQAKKVFGVGDRVQQTWFGSYNVPDRYSAFYQDTPDNYYRYADEGYIYQVDRRSDLISGLLPLLGGGFSVGQPLPAGYDAYNVPYQYRDTYQDTDDSYYRYGDDAIYEVDPQSGMIEGIVALLGGDLNVGEQLPEGYDAYNLPNEYRDEYQDNEDYDYRYADGNIYQVDTKTQIIQAIMEALV